MNFHTVAHILIDFGLVPDSSHLLWTLMSHSHGFHTAATTYSKATEAAAVPEAAAEASAGEAKAEAVKAKTMANAMAACWQAPSIQHILYNINYRTMYYFHCYYYSVD